MAKPIELTLSYFGKTISQKQYSSVLHVGDLYKMFRGIMISEFGQDTWDNLTKVQDKVKHNDEKEDMIESIVGEDMDFYDMIDRYLPRALNR
jgi:hypothetical protein